MVATVEVPRVAICQMPMKATNSAIDTIAARKRSEAVMPQGPSASRPGERRDPQPPALLDAEDICHRCQTKFHGVWVPAFAGTTATNLSAPLRYDAFLILKLLR